MSLKTREELETVIAQKSGKEVEEIRRLINEKLALYPIRPRAAASMVAGDLGIPLKTRFTKGRIPSPRGESIKINVEEVLADPEKYSKSSLKFEGYVFGMRKFNYGENKEKEALSFDFVDPTGHISGIGFKSVAVSLFEGIEEKDAIAINGAGAQLREGQVGIIVWPSVFIEKIETPKGWKTIEELQLIYLTRTLEEVFDGRGGIVTVSIVSIVDTRTYQGCPECFKGIKGDDLCKEHDLEPVELHWITIFVGDESMESAIGLPPSAAIKLPDFGIYDFDELVGKTMVCNVRYQEERGLMFNSLISIGELEEKKKEEKPRVICPECGEGFPSKEALKAHELIAHKEEGIEVKTLKELEEPKKLESPVEDAIKRILALNPNLTKEAVKKLIDEERAKAGGLLTEEAAAHLVASNLDLDGAEEKKEVEEEKITVEVSEKDYKLAKDLVSFLVPASLDSIKVELESTVEGDAMALLTKMKADGFIEIKDGQVGRV